MVREFFEFIGGLLIMLIALGIVGFFIGFAIWSHNVSYGNEQTIEIEVQDKYTKGKSGTYYVVDGNDNTYEVRDMFWLGKYNSTDIYNKLKIGKKYRVKTTGERIHFWSMYPNINEIIEEL